MDPTIIFRQNRQDDNYIINSHNDIQVKFTDKLWTNSGELSSRFDVSTVHFTNTVQCSSHGYVYTPLAVEVFGYWASERIADMLPFEYGYNSVEK